MPSKSRKKEKQRAKQVQKQAQKQERVKTLQQQEGTPAAPVSSFSSSSPAAQPVNPTQLERHRLHTALLQIKKLYTNSADTTQALLTFLNPLARFPDTLPCCHGCEHGSSYRHIWPHSPLEDMRAEGEEIKYWIRYLTLIKQWVIITKAELAALDDGKTPANTDKVFCKVKEGYPRSVGQQDRDLDVSIFLSNFGPFPLLVPCCAVCCDRCPIRGIQELRRRETQSWIRYYDSMMRRMMEMQTEEAVVDVQVVKEELTKKCIKGTESSQTNNEVQEPEGKPDIRFSLDICRHLFKQLVPPDLDEAEHELSAEPCRLAFHQCIMTSADVRQLTKDCIDGIEGLLDELQSKAEALRAGWAEESAVEDDVGEDEDEDEDRHTTSYDWMKDLMSADKIDGEDGEIPTGFFEYWRYSKGYFHLYL